MGSVSILFYGVGHVTLSSNLHQSTVLNSPRQAFFLSIIFRLALSLMDLPVSFSPLELLFLFHQAYHFNQTSSDFLGFPQASPSSLPPPFSSTWNLFPHPPSPYGESLDIYSIYLLFARPVETLIHRSLDTRCQPAILQLASTLILSISIYYVAASWCGLSRHGLSARSLGTVSRHGLSARSLGTVSRHGLSARSLGQHKRNGTLHHDAPPLAQGPRS
jgi:hypothetical protein